MWSKRELKIIDFLLPFAENSIKESQRAKVETGFRICETKRGLEPTTLCSGGVCSVSIAPCKKGKAVASFHSHPSLKDGYVTTQAISAQRKKLDVEMFGKYASDSRLTPSEDDVMFSAGQEHEIDCIGNRDGVACFVTEQSKQKKLDFVFALTDYETYRDEMRKFFDRDMNDEARKMSIEVVQPSYEKYLKTYKAMIKKAGAVISEDI